MVSKVKVVYIATGILLLLTFWLASKLHTSPNLHPYILSTSVSALVLTVYLRIDYLVSTRRLRREAAEYEERVNK